MSVSDGFFACAGLVDGFERQGDFDEFLGGHGGILCGWVDGKILPQREQRAQRENSLTTEVTEDAEKNYRMILFFILLYIDS